MEDNKYIYLDSNNIRVNKYGIRTNRSTPCVMYAEGDKWIVERKDMCDKQGSDCTVWLSSFICVLTMPSTKSYRRYRGGLEWLN